MVITIDGLGVNGKSTLAKMLSNYLNFKNFNTGAIYRCIALEIIDKKLDVNNIQELQENLRDININFDNENVILNGIDVSKKIRTEEISYFSTKWATIIEIKEIVRKIQKDFIKKFNTVMEGRDIGTRIAPDAEYKFYLYSDFETRVKRLYSQTPNIDINVIRNDLKIRDDLDLNKGNFIKPLNAIEINTSNLTIEEVFELMKNKINKLQFEGENK